MKKFLFWIPFCFFIVTCGTKVSQQPVVTQETVGTPGTLGVKNHRQYLNFLHQSLQLKNTTVFNLLQQQGNYLQLPENNSIKEVTFTTLLAATAVASQFCKSFLEEEKSYLPEERVLHQNFTFKEKLEEVTEAQMADLLKGYALALWGRNPTPEETQYFKALFLESKNLGDALFLLCTAYSASLESLIL